MLHTIWSCGLGTPVRLVSCTFGWLLLLRLVHLVRFFSLCPVLAACRMIAKSSTSHPTPEMMRERTLEIMLGNTRWCGVLHMALL